MIIFRRILLGFFKYSKISSSNIMFRTLFCSLFFRIDLNIFYTCLRDTKNCDINCVIFSYIVLSSCHSDTIIPFSVFVLCVSKWNTFLVLEAGRDIRERLSTFSEANSCHLLRRVFLFSGLAARVYILTPWKFVLKCVSMMARHMKKVYSHAPLRYFGGKLIFFPTEKLPHF